MIFNELPTAFPWYDMLEKQNRYKGQSDGFCDYKLISPRDALLPFQFRRDAVNADRIVAWEILEINSNVVVAAVTASINKIYVRTTVDGFDYFSYNGEELAQSLPGGLAELNLDYGFYYSRITFEIGTPFYSEMFHIPENSFENEETDLKFLKFEWYNTTDVKPFYFGDQVDGVPYFRNVCYLETFVHASEPEIIEEGTRDGDDQLIPTFQKAFINYRVTHLVPDFLKVALVLMQLHDVKKITDGVRTGEINNLSTNSTLEANGFYSTVDLLFTQDLLIINKSCNDPIELKAPVFDMGEFTLGSAVQGATETTFAGNAPINLIGYWLNVWGSAYKLGPYGKVASNKPSGELTAGTLTIPNTADNWFKIEAENINGSLGFTNFIIKT